MPMADNVDSVRASSHLGLLMEASTASRYNRRQFLQAGGLGGLLVVGGGFLAACGASTTGNTTSRGASASELTIVIPSDPPGLDPLVYSDAATDYLIITMIVETLYQYGPDRVIQPLLAVSPPTISTDGLTYTIPLRQGVTFTNGKAFDAADVKYSIEAIQNPKYSSWAFSDTTTIKSVATPDSHTVVLTLTAPTTFMEDVLAVLPMIPSNIPYTHTVYAQKPVGTGPYQLSQWNHGQNLLLEKNPKYWDKGLPYIGTVTYEIVPSSASTLADLATKQAQIVPNLSPVSASTARSRGAQLYVPAGVNDIQWLWPNWAAGTPTSNVNLRLAMAWAINRQRIVNDVYKGFGQPESTMPASGAYYYNSALGQFFGGTANLAKAKHYLALAGGPPKSPLEYLVPSGDPNVPAAAVLVQEDLKAIGIETNITTVDQGTWLTTAEAGKFDLTMISTVVLIPGTQPNLLWGKTSFNINKVNDTKLQELSEAALVVPTKGSAAQAASFAVQQRVTETVPIITLCTAHTIYALAPGVTGFSVVNNADMHNVAQTKYTA
jgi:peptide/nickel transport system substrate-binding protein